MKYVIKRKCYGELILFLHMVYKPIELEPISKDSSSRRVTFVIKSMGGFSEDKVNCVLQAFIEGTKV